MNTKCVANITKSLMYVNVGQAIVFGNNITECKDHMSEIFDQCSSLNSLYRVPSIVLAPPDVDQEVFIITGPPEGSAQ